MAETDLIAVFDWPIVIFVFRVSVVFLGFENVCGRRWSVLFVIPYLPVTSNYREFENKTVSSTDTMGASPGIKARGYGRRKECGKRTIVGGH